MSDKELPLYLIAHKVRGEPAFDIATREEVEGEEHWIIPTSGHRAYPYWWIEFDELRFETQGTADTYISQPVNRVVPEIPLDLRDHYTISAAAERKAARAEIPTTKDLSIGRDILKDLGLLPKAQPIRRL